MKDNKLINKPSRRRLFKIVIIIIGLMAILSAATYVFLNRASIFKVITPLTSAQKIIKLAKSYSQADSLTAGIKWRKADATLSYQKAGEELDYDDSDNPISKTSKRNDWNEASRFISAVMINSGVDDEFPKVGATTQYEYALSNPKKYMVIKQAFQAETKAGDILHINGQHTLIVAKGGNSDKYYDASWGIRVPNTRSGLKYWFSKYPTTISIIRTK